MSQCKARNGFESQEAAAFINAINPLVSKYSTTTDSTETLVLRVQSARFGTLDVPAASSMIGPPVPSGGLRGVVAVPSPPTGCTDMGKCFVAPTFGVVRRGSCWFSEKVLNVQSAGGVAAVIADNTTQALFTMSHTQQAGMPPIAIPSVLISKEHGDRIDSWIALGEQLNAQLTPVSRLK